MTDVGARELTILLPADLTLFTAALAGVMRRYPRAVIRNDGDRYVILVDHGKGLE